MAKLIWDGRLTQLCQITRSDLRASDTQGVLKHASASSQRSIRPALP